VMSDGSSCVLVRPLRLLQVFATCAALALVQIACCQEEVTMTAGSSLGKTTPAHIERSRKLLQDDDGAESVKKKSEPAISKDGFVLFGNTAVSVGSHLPKGLDFVKNPDTPSPPPKSAMVAPTYNPGELGLDFENSVIDQPVEEADSPLAPTYADPVRVITEQQQQMSIGKVAFSPTSSRPQLHDLQIRRSTPSDDTDDKSTRRQSNNVQPMPSKAGEENVLAPQIPEDNNQVYVFWAFISFLILGQGAWYMYSLTGSDATKQQPLPLKKNANDLKSKLRTIRDSASI